MINKYRLGRLLIKLLKPTQYSPFVSVCGILEEKNKILLIKNDYKTSLPGGLVRQGEELETALKREFFEETGLNIDVVKFLKYYDSPKRDTDSHSILFTYKVKKIKGKLKTSFEGEPVWVEKSKVKRIIHSENKKVIEDYLK